VIVDGVIPLLSISYPGEIVWISGFADSFLDIGWASLKAVNFGIPALYVLISLRLPAR
jgi:hypothetical protein